MGYQQVGDKKNVIYRRVSVLFPQQLIVNASEWSFYLVEGLVQSDEGTGNYNGARQQYRCLRKTDNYSNLKGRYFYFSLG